MLTGKKSKQGITTGERGGKWEAEENREIQEGESKAEVKTFYLFQIYAFLYSFAEGEIPFEPSIIFARCDKQFFI